MEFDYLIAGGGSAGATLAARLSEDPKIRVCLIEAGGRGDGLMVRAPTGAVTMLPGWGKFNNWAFQTVPQAGLNGRRGYQPRGRSLGGSSAINAMLYIRGQAQDYDDWAAAGCTGWGWADVLPYFRRAENNQGGADDWHGGDGPLQVSHQSSPLPITRAFIDAAQSLQIPARDDFNRGDNEGVGLYQVTQFHSAAKRGERCSAAAAYLHPILASRPNLRVITHARVLRIVTEGKRAVGLSYRQGGVLGGQDQTLRATREVILCGGAFGSPQLLQLSGIGRGKDLQALGITVQHDLRGVGQNLQDHLDVTLGFTTPDTTTFGISLRGGINLMRQIARWRRDGTGLIASPFAEGAGFVRSSPDVDRADLQLHFVIALVDDHARKLHLGHGFSLHTCVLRPHSRGSVALASADPMAAPLIDPAYLSDPRDLDLLVKGAKIARSILMAPALAPYRGREVFGTHDAMTDAEWEAFIRARSDTIYHPVGTCKMGVDDAAVVDPQLRLRGMAGLRVVDASVMPALVSGNTNAPTIMIAERAAEMIRADAKQGVAA